MKIAIAIPHLGLGGGERVVSLLSEELIKQNQEVVLLLTIDDIKYPLSEELHKNIRLSASKSNSKVIRTYRRLLELRRNIKNEQPDVIISFGYLMSIYIAISAWGLKVKKIATERTDPNCEPHSNILKLLRNACYNKFETLICQTSDAKNYYQNKIKSQIHVIPNPVKTDLPYWDDTNNNKVIVTACRLEPQKNLSLMIRSFKQVSEEYPEWKLHIYGKGNLLDSLKKLVHDLNLDNQVCFKGFSNNIHEVMANSSMYISSSDYEGISNSMLEAMAIGMPIICTDCPIGGAKEFIKHLNNGILIQTNNEDELVSAIKFMIENNNKSILMGNNAQIIRNELSVPIILKKWIDIIR